MTSHQRRHALWSRSLFKSSIEVADLESWKPVASTEVSLEQHTNESSDCQVPGLVYLLVVVRAVADREVVPESQVVNCIGESGNGT